MGVENFTAAPGSGTRRAKRARVLLAAKLQTPYGEIDARLRDLSQKGALFLTRPTLYHYVTTRPELEAAAGELFEAVLSGRVKIEIRQRFALKDAADAHRALEARQTTGSTVLTV